MSQRRREFDVVALAKRINLRREEYNRTHTTKVRITSAMSRILENDPDYVPYRPRAASKTYPPSTNPSVASVGDIARRLETTVGDLLGEPWPVSPTERKMLVAAVAAMDRLLGQFNR